MTNFFRLCDLPVADRDSRLPQASARRNRGDAAKEPFAAALRLLAGSFIALYEGSPEMTALLRRARAGFCVTRFWRSIFRNAAPVKQEREKPS